MMIEKEEMQRATITELMAKETPDKNKVSNFFKAPGSREAEDVEHKHNAQCIEVKDRLRKANMLVPGSGLGPEYNDEYRRIKRPLMSNAFGKTAKLVERGNLILVTSSLPGEGKTHTAINLALSIAQERDHTVLLVDCDVTRHGTSRLMGISDRPGLVEILENDATSVGDMILRTDVDELCLISAGKQHDYVTELLASQRMRSVVEEIGARYDDRVIIFDAPPLLPTPQTQVLTELVGQVVFVIEAGKTPQSVVDEAIAMIPEGQATGIVMNKSEGMLSRGDYYYGYYSKNKRPESD